MHKKHIVPYNISVKKALKKLNTLNLDKVLFLTDREDKLVGSITDGDVRRGLLSGLTLNY